MGMRTSGLEMRRMWTCSLCNARVADGLETGTDRCHDRPSDLVICNLLAASSTRSVHYNQYQYLFYEMV